MQVVGRQYNLGGGRYRYGFNGKENDNEVKGDGNQIDFGARVYDPRVGRFLSGDPLEDKFPWQSTYVYAANNPIKFIDVDGEYAGPGPAPAYSRPVMRVIRGGQYGSGYLNPYRDVQFDANGHGFVEPNPLSTAEQVRQAEEHRREEFLLNNTMVDGKWVPRFEDEVRTLRNLRANKILDGLNKKSDNPFEGFSLQKFKNNNLFSDANFIGPAVTNNLRGEPTNGKYTVDLAGMKPHLTGDLSTGKSQFLFSIDANKAVLDAAAYADKNNLWNPNNNGAKVPVTNGYIGVTGKKGELTRYLNIYRTKTNYVHGSPGNAPKK